LRLLAEPRPQAAEWFSQMALWPAAIASGIARVLFAATAVGDDGAFGALWPKPRKP
jgi:hypothetical protein